MVLKNSKDSGLAKADLLSTSSELIIFFTAISASFPLRVRGKSGTAIMREGTWRGLVLAFI